MPYQIRFSEPETFKKNKRDPNFENILKVLEKKEPDRPTLFEFFLNEQLYMMLADESALEKFDEYRDSRLVMSVYKNAGYDYFTLHASKFGFKVGNAHSKKTRSLNDSAVITDRESYEKYVWDNPEDYSCSALEQLGREMPDGMKIIVYGPSGVLENVVAIVGYDNLCFMLADDPELVGEIFNQVGSRLLKYYEIALQYESVGAAIVNDDWGFNTQTMLSTSDMKKYVIPWHKKIVSAIHAAGRPAIMHSCGNLNGVWDDIIYTIGFDGKHSYEDKIEPVEQAYERLQGKIAVMGGIDVDYICRHTPEEVYNRSKAMLKRTRGRGGYALGSGNSIPYYVPYKNYLAMIAAARFELD